MKCLIMDSEDQLEIDCLCIYNYNDINKPSVIPQVGSGEGRVYTDLTPTLEGREAVFDRQLDVC